MLQKHWLNLHRALVLIAVLVSALLYVHYLDPGDSALCGSDGGCEVVRASGYVYYRTPYLNVPLVGIVAYGALLALSLGTMTPARANLLRWLAGLGGVLAIGLILVQALVIKAFCWLCLIVDTAAIGAAFTASAAHLALDRQRPLLATWSWVGLFVACAGLPISWYVVRPEPAVPGLVRQLFVPGKINVIEFADFQCPHCRRLHQTLKPLLSEYGDRVHLKRLHVPLGMHRHAHGAALAALCAEDQGKGEAMADRLFEGHLGDEHYPKYASQIGLDLPRFEACLKDPSTDARIEQDVARFRDSDLRGLPTTFVDQQRIGGARPVGVFREALEKATLAEPGFTMSGSVFLLGSLALGIALVVGGRQKQS